MNLYQQLLGLLPSRPLQVGEITAIVGGVASIMLPDGGVTQARGDGSVGDRVFFRDGAIEGPAPALDYVEIEI